MRTKNLISRWLSLSGAVIITVFLGISLSPMPAWAVPVGFEFEGSDASGTGSAIMTFDDTEFGTNTLNIDLDNTSPITLDSNTDPNAPGITAFGFDAEDPVPTIVSWTLFAFDSNSVGSVIASDQDTSLWDITNTTQGIQLDFIADNTSGINAALYNPDCLNDAACFGQIPAGSNISFFTTATLTLNFNGPVTPSFHDAGTGGTDPSPLVRMQNVGENGGGSLKLGGTPTTPVPEPGTLLLLGSGLAGLGFLNRCKRRREI